MAFKLPTPPAFLARLGRRVPTPLATLPLVAGLAVARRLAWLLPPEELDGRRFAITVEDLGLRACFECRKGHFLPLLSAIPELELRAAMADFVALASAREDADTLFFQRRLKIEGDTELGLVVKNWLDASDRPAWLQKLA